MKPLSDDSDFNVVEQHGCIVCGKVYNMLVVYAPDGRLVDCTVNSPGGRRVEDSTRPLVTCTHHHPDVIKTALARHYPGKSAEDLENEN
jgi:hypothetical protein